MRAARVGGRRGHHRGGCRGAGAQARGGGGRGVHDRRGRRARRRWRRGEGGVGEPRRRAAPSSGRARATQKRFCPTTTVGKAVARRRAPKRHANENVVEGGRHSKPRSRRPPRAHGVPVDARGRGTGGGDRGVPRHHLRRRASPRGGRRARPRRRVRHGPKEFAAGVRSNRCRTPSVGARTGTSPTAYARETDDTPNTRGTGAKPTS